jgi:hypothetical protein
VLLLLARVLLLVLVMGHLQLLLLTALTPLLHLTSV